LDDASDTAAVNAQTKRLRAALRERRYISSQLW
jgi:hypothetical protein